MSIQGVLPLRPNYSQEKREAMVLAKVLQARGAEMEDSRW